MKRLITITIIAIIALCAITPALAEVKQEKGVVMEIKMVSAELWEVSAITADGNIYAWYEDNADGEYWHIGDLVLMEMTEGEEITDVLLIRELTPVEVARWMQW